MGAIDAFTSLFRDDTNKAKTAHGVLDALPELELEMSDDELIHLSDQWEKRYSGYEAEIKKRQEKNKDYWKGKHEANKFNAKGQVDNLIFEALETFLPLATKKNPEPFVRGDDTPEGQFLTKTVQGFLVYHADRLRMKLRMKRAARDWAVKLIGVKKEGWSEVENDITSEVRKPENFIFDTDGTVNDDMEYTGAYIGERMSAKASELIARFPAKEAYIKEKVEGKLGTTLSYVEWWACNPADYVFWKLDKEILGKARNPHWNYDTKEPQVDEYGKETMVPVKGRNHFNAPKAPYVFLSIFNTGDQPHDETSLIEQNIPNQDLINKLTRQMDANAESMNGGIVVSGERSGLTQDQATEATEALRAGGTVWIPSGAANEAIYRDQAPPLPADLFNLRADTREELRNIFGTRGSSPSGTINEQTATGKQLVREQDSDRIGGGISEYLEQFADAEFNWWLQLMYVYYDEEHLASIVGAEKAIEYLALSSEMLQTKLTVSVKENSLVPDSDIEKAIEAKELLLSGNLDPTTAFDRLGFPNPRETAQRTYQWKAAPDTLFPEVAPMVQASQVAAQVTEQEVAAQAPVPPKA